MQCFKHQASNLKWIDDLKQSHGLGFRITLAGALSFSTGSPRPVASRSSSSCPSLSVCCVCHVLSYLIFPPLPAALPDWMLLPLFCPCDSTREARGKEKTRLLRKRPGAETSSSKHCQFDNTANHFANRRPYLWQSVRQLERNDLNGLWDNNLHDPNSHLLMLSDAHPHAGSRNTSFLIQGMKQEFLLWRLEAKRANVVKGLQKS